MKIWNWILVCSMLLFLLGCSKDHGAADEQKILDYLKANNLEATRDESGVYYIITKEGNEGEHPTVQSRVTVRYKGYLLNGNVFDQTIGNEVRTFGLFNVIQGWQIGIPLMTRGSEATLFIPSSLGYGDSSRSGIPANSVLIFEVKLIDFTP
jgi:FKBP-type peptidyl-prolyl cis-trans isomerase FkpA